MKLPYQVELSTSGDDPPIKFQLKPGYPPFAITRIHQLFLFIIVLLGAVLRLWGILQPNLHLWDERFHALVAKNIALHWWVPTFYFKPLLEYDPSNWQGNHIWLHKPPLGLWLGALSMKIFGISEWAYRIPSFFFGTFSILLTYWIGKRLWDERIALLAAFFHSISGLVLIFNSGTYGMDNIDNALFFFVQLSIFFWIRFLRGTPSTISSLKGRESGGTIFFSGIAMGFGLLSKSYPALLSWGIFVSLMVFEKYRTKKHLIHSLLMLSTALVFFIPWQLYTSFQWQEEFQAAQKVLWGHFFESQIPGRDNPFYHFCDIPRDYGEFAVLAIPLFFWFLFRAFSCRSPDNNSWGENLDSLKNSGVNFWIGALWFSLPYIIFSAARTKISTLVYYCAPSIFFMLAFAATFFWQRREKKFYLFLLIIGCLLTFRVTGEKIIQIGTGLFAVPKARVIEQISAIQEKAVIFNIPEYAEIMFFADSITAYPFLPTESQIRSLVSQNYSIFSVKQPSQNFIQWQKNLSPKTRDAVKLIEPIVYNERIGFWSRMRGVRIRDFFRKES